MCQRLWWWNVHCPGLSVLKAIATVLSGGMSTVFRTPSWTRAPSTSTIWKQWPRRCIGWGIIVLFCMTNFARLPAATAIGAIFG